MRAIKMIMSLCLNTSQWYKINFFFAKRHLQNTLLAFFYVPNLTSHSLNELQNIKVLFESKYPTNICFNYFYFVYYCYQSARLDSTSECYIDYFITVFVDAEVITNGALLQRRYFLSLPKR